MNGTVKASKLETLGAWLGLWTPPRGVVVPPVPWRKVALAAAGLALVAAAIAVFVAPQIDDAKDDRRRTAQRELAERKDARRARINRLQQPRFGVIASTANLQTTLSTVEAAIADDARARFSDKTKAATCETSPGVDTTAERIAYDCLATTSTIEGAADQEGAQGELGYPYRAVLDLKRSRYAYCRIFPLPGEQALADPRTAIKVPEQCSIASG